jgi:autotransporter-associated beta strand protein
MATCLIGASSVLGCPNVLVSQMSYNSLADVPTVSGVGRGVWALYDVTSYFPQVQFGLANNSSQPDASYLTDGTNLDGSKFARPLNKYGTGTLIIAGDATYTGGTTIFGGTLMLRNGGTGGSILGNVVFSPCIGAATLEAAPGSITVMELGLADVGL